jgi:PPOX class probable F420-dependent enzyme
MTEDEQWAVLRTKNLGVLVTIKRDGRPQLSNVSYGLDEQAGAILVSVTDDRAKTRNLRRDPRASFYVTSDDMGTYIVAECTATLTPVAQDPDDEVVDQLVEHYRLVRGEHPDWPDFRAAMVRDRRVLVRLAVERTYGLVQ